MSGIFEKSERCVIEDTEILTREDVKQQVKEFSFDLPFLLQPVSAILLAAENAAIGWNTGCFWSLCCSAHITKATLTCFVSLTVTLTHTQIRQPVSPAQRRWRCASPSWRWAGLALPAHWRSLSIRSRLGQPSDSRCPAAPSPHLPKGHNCLWNGSIALHNAPCSCTCHAFLIPTKDF